MTEKAINRRFPHLLRLPSFGMAIGVSVAALLAFAVWMFVDASFSMTLDVVRIDLGLDEHPGVILSDWHAWGQLGSRLVLFAVLAGIGVLATLLVFYRIFFGSRQGRSLRSLFVAVAMVGLWLALGVSHEKLESAGFHYRLGRAVQGLKQDAAILSAEWPTTDGELPYSGEYRIDADDPPMLYIMAAYIEMWPMRESIGPYVRRTDGGGIRFNYNFTDMIEFHPEGSKPSSFTESKRMDGQEILRDSHVLDHFAEVQTNWYFVSYVFDVPLIWCNP